MYSVNCSLFSAKLTKRLMAVGQWCQSCSGDWVRTSAAWGHLYYCLSTLTPSGCGSLLKWRKILYLLAWLLKRKKKRQEKTKNHFLPLKGRRETFWQLLNPSFHPQPHNWSLPPSLASIPTLFSCLCTLFFSDVKGLALSNFLIFTCILCLLFWMTFPPVSF